MDPRLYPGGNQSIDPRNVETVVTQTDLIETIDAAKTNDRKAVSIIDLLANLRVVRSIRSRFTSAQVNAGAALLPAVPGYRWRMASGRAIAVGGSATGLTTLDLIGTQGATPVKLIAFGQAQLTQNTVVKDGATGGTVLAGGASYGANDANTAVTVGKTGDPLATATHVDVMGEWVLEKA